MSQGRANWHGDRLKLPITSDGGGNGFADRQPKEAAQGRPSIQVWFACAGLYQRVFRAADGSGYLARCSLCGKTMRFRVGPDGTGQRVFQVSC